MIVVQQPSHRHFIVEITRRNNIDKLREIVPFSYRQLWYSVILGFIDHLHSCEK